jgi:hypothetical protein
MSAGARLMVMWVEGMSYPVATLAHRRVGESDGMKVILIGLDAGDVHLNLNDAGIDAIDRCAQGLIEHEVVRPQTGGGAV